MIALSSESISIETVEQSVQHPDCGADLLFVGRVRGLYKGQQVQYLEYEAYTEMTLACMQSIVLQAQQAWDARVSIVHRIGTVYPTEISIVIAVATPHRAASYQASQFVLEALKRDVPIWKREVTENGAAWKNNSPLPLSNE